MRLKITNCPAALEIESVPEMAPASREPLAIQGSVSQTENVNPYMANVSSRKHLQTVTHIQLRHRFDRDTDVYLQCTTIGDPWAAKPQYVEHKWNVSVSLQRFPLTCGRGGRHSDGEPERRTPTVNGSGACPTTDSPDRTNRLTLQNTRPGRVCHVC
jgi:hypothetical protein